MKIFSYDLIEEETLNENHHFQNDLGIDVSFTTNYDPRLVVNMDFKGHGQSGTNAQGWLRDQSIYFNALLVNHSDAFSERNKELIKIRRVPNCDKKFTDYFNVYKGYEGNKLIHHHIGRDGQAIALPQDLHVGTGGVHIAEMKVGIEDLTKSFSDRVQIDYDDGKKFDWMNANDYYSKIAEEKKISDMESKYDQTVNDTKIEPSKTNKPNSKLEYEKSDHVAIVKETSNSLMKDFEKKSKISKGVNIKISPESAKIFLKIGLGIGTAIVLATGAVVSEKKPVRTKNINQIRNSKPIMKMAEKAVEISENIVVEETFDKKRVSPIFHNVKGHLKKNGKYIKGYSRGKK